MTLTGTHHVRALKSALHKSKKHWPAVGDRMEVRRQTLKLRYWGNRHADSILDLSFESIKSLPSMGVYELRLDDEIGGLRNLRVVFFEPPDQWRQIQPTPLPNLWVLEAIPKKRNEWTQFDIARFKALRAVVKERFYEG